MEKLRNRFLWIALSVVWLWVGWLLLRAVLYGEIPAPTKFSSRLITFVEAPVAFVVSTIMATGIFVAIPLLLRSIRKTDRSIDTHLRRQVPNDKGIRRTEDDR